jgi:hypothetical protein
MKGGSLRQTEAGLSPPAMSGKSVHQDFALNPVDRLIPRHAF